MAMLMVLGVGLVWFGLPDGAEPLDELRGPERVRDVVRHRLTRLAPEATDLLELAAVAGPRFELPVLATAAGTTPAALARPVEEGTRSGMIEELPEPPPPPEVPADVAAAPADAIKTASGLAYKVLKPGTGTVKPTATSTVEVHYSGWTTDGKMFDSSVTRGEPTSFGLNQVIKGWTEGVQLMTVGEKARFWIPGDLAYGDKPTRPGAPSGMLVFDIELIAIK